MKNSVIEEFRKNWNGKWAGRKQGRITIYSGKDIEAFITNALNQQRTEERERIKLCAKEQSCSGCMEWIANNPK